MRAISRLLLAGFCAVVLAIPAFGQEFRVYTRVFDQRATASAKNSKKTPSPISRTMTIFHAGKVYDSIDSGERITLFEPNRDRFLILDFSRQLRTVITTKEILETISVIEGSQQERLKTKAGQTAIEKERIQLIQFQLAPDFVESVDDSKLTLRLLGTGAQYDVKAITPEKPEYSTAYLEYADWAARLNYLLLENAPLPGPRLALDDSLRNKNWLPIEVEMQARQKYGPHLRAEHRYDWKLDDADRKFITKAENEIGQPKLKEIDFDRYYDRTRARQVQAKR